jgi:molybdopterin-guanine dinucleotide biosynthesis protein A
MARHERGGLSGIVLAGGKSQRIGRDKALLELEGRTLITHVLDRLSPLCGELIISTNAGELYTHLPARIIPDVIPGRGALSGIHAGLAAMRNERAIVVACDMPFLNLPFLRYMVSIAPGYDVVVPRPGRDYEPLHAVYAASCVEPIAQLVAEGPRRIVELYQRVQVREVTAGEVRLFDADLSFFNVNTPEEWARARRLAARRRRAGGG